MTYTIAIVLIIGTATAVQGCMLPSTESEACAITAKTMNCTRSICCLTCPGSACSSGDVRNSSMPEYFTDDSSICKSAEVSKVHRPCGSPSPVVYTRHTSHGFKFEKWSHDDDHHASGRVKSAILVEGAFLGRRAKNIKAPTVTCYAKATNAVLGTGPTYTANNNLLKAPIVPTARGQNSFEFSLGGVSDRAWVNSYMCGFEQNSTGPLVSPLAVASLGYWGEASYKPEHLTTHVREGEDLFLDVPGAMGDTNRLWFLHDKFAGRGHNITKTNASCKDAGLYRVFSDDLKSEIAYLGQGLARVILTNAEVSSDKCSGGMLFNNACICPPGLRGANCEGACRDNSFGDGCEFSLPSRQSGAVLCLPDPYGCDCIPGYTGEYCDNKCSPGSFGKECKHTCHCNVNTTCSSFNGRCSDDQCAPGYQGDNCQQKCDSRRYGPGCTQICNCANETECHFVNGPTKGCVCDPKYVGEYCKIEAVKPHGTISVVTDNPGIAPRVMCTVTGVPRPKQSETTIRRLGANDTSLQTLILNETSSHLVLEANETRPLSAGETIIYQCCVETKAGKTCENASAKAIELPKLISRPKVEYTTENSIKLRFESWNEKTDEGVGPAEHYRACIRKASETSWMYVAQRPAVCESCALLVEGLTPDTNYDLAVAVRRPGAGMAWGECGPTVTDFTRKGNTARTAEKVDEILKKLAELEKNINVVKNQTKVTCPKPSQPVGVLSP